MTPVELAAAFDAHSRALTLYARQVLGEGDHAADVVQDAFVRLVQQRVAPRSLRARSMAAIRSCRPLSSLGSGVSSGVRVSSACWYSFCGEVTA